MKHIRRLLIVIFVVAAVITVANVSPWAPTLSKVSSKWIRKTGELPLVIPHGGAKEMYPENTMYAFDNTSQYDAFEIDLALTDDNILITHHDLHLGLMAGRNDLRVRSLKYQEILDVIKDEGYPHVRGFDGSVKKEDYSEWTDEEILDSGLVPVPLEQVFQKYPDKLYILEIKDNFIKDEDPLKTQIYEQTSLKAIDELIYLIKKYNMKDNVLVASFDDKVVKTFNKKTNDEISTIGGSIDTAILSILSYFKLDFFHFAKFEALSLPYNEVLGGSLVNTLNKFPKFIRNIIATTEEDGTLMYNMKRIGFLKDAQRKNISVVYWTVNDKEDMIELVKRGADGIITDNPELLVEVLNLFK